MLGVLPVSRDMQGAVGTLCVLRRLVALIFLALAVHTMIGALGWLLGSPTSKQHQCQGVPGHLPVSLTLASKQVRHTCGVGHAALRDQLLLCRAYWVPQCVVWLSAALWGQAL
jgi:hypothetical protein